jgi:phosphatidylserine/phosphatidylglycerophosphate/cardiolipin synthase-like enzyme
VTNSRQTAALQLSEGRIKCHLQARPFKFTQARLGRYPTFGLAIAPRHRAIIMSFFHNAKAALHSFTTDLKQELDVVEGSLEDEIHSHTHLNKACHNLHMYTRDNRFHSFAPPRRGNDAKWFVDGCGYFWAVSVALEEAKESIWILDWWLSPGLLKTLS